MAERFDISTLRWLKGEIDETLEQARVAITNYIEEGRDENQIGFCVSYLHQVRGSLQLVELHGATQLASEMEATANALQQGLIQEAETAVEVLMRAFLQLPDYLEALHDGLPDNPVILLPIMNELRLARGDAALSDAAFFTPDLTIEAPAPTAPTADLRPIAAKARAFYQSHLVKLLQDKELDAGLKAVASVFEKLVGVTQDGNLRRWLWVIAGMVEGVREKGIAWNKEVKQQLGRAEQVFKLLAADGDQAVPAELIEKLTRSALFQVAGARSSGARVQALKSAFRLDSLLPGSEVIELARSRLGGFNTALKRTVAADLMEELTRAKETLDIVSRRRDHAAEDLGKLVTGLSAIASTVELLQQQALADALKAEVEAIRALIANASAITDQQLMAIAEVMLAVESALADWGTGGLADGESEAGEVTPAEAEHRRVIRQVMREAKTDLIAIKESINRFLAAPDDKAPLKEMAGPLHRLIGTMGVVGYERVGTILRACDLFLTERMLDADAVPPDEQLDLLADALTSIEYYFEAFVESRVHPASALEVAERSVATLGYAVDNLPQPKAPEEPIAVPAPVSTTAEQPEAAGAVAAGDGSPAVAQPAPVAVAAPVPARPAPVPPEQDEEIIEIFVEEAHEQFDSIAGLYPRWRSTPSDAETLKDLRRCFHTLKGSGRLVGARDLGEFAWAFESMLNRVIDGTTAPGPLMFDLIAAAREPMEELLLCFRTGEAPSAYALALQAMAQALCSPDVPAGLTLPSRESVAAASVAEPVEELPAAPAEVVESAAPAPEPEAEAPTLTEPVVPTVQPAVLSAAAGQLPEMDPVLLEIYSLECLGHLDTLADFVSRCREQGGRCRIENELVRALHTLRGASRTANVPPVARLSGILEDYAKLLQIDSAPLPDPMLGLLGDVATEVRGFIDALARSDSELPDLGPLTQRAEQLAKGAPLAPLVEPPELSVAAAEPSPLAAPELASEAELVPEAELSTEAAAPFEEPAAAAPLVAEPEVAIAAAPTDETAAYITEPGISDLELAAEAEAGLLEALMAETAEPATPVGSEPTAPEELLPDTADLAAEPAATVATIPEPEAEGEPFAEPESIEQLYADALEEALLADAGTLEAELLAEAETPAQSWAASPDAAEVTGDRQAEELLAGADLDLASTLIAPELAEEPPALGEPLSPAERSDADFDALAAELSAMEEEERRALEPEIPDLDLAGGAPYLEEAVAEPLDLELAIPGVAGEESVWESGALLAEAALLDDSAAGHALDELHELELIGGEEGSEEIYAAELTAAPALAAEEALDALLAGGPAAPEQGYQALPALADDEDAELAALEALLAEEPFEGGTPIDEPPLPAAATDEPVKPEIISEGFESEPFETAEAAEPAELLEGATAAEAPAQPAEDQAVLPAVSEAAESGWLAAAEVTGEEVSLAAALAEAGEEGAWTAPAPMEGVAGEPIPVLGESQPPAATPVQPEVEPPLVAVDHAQAPTDTEEFNLEGAEELFESGEPELLPDLDLGLGEEIEAPLPAAAIPAGARPVAAAPAVTAAEIAQPVAAKPAEPAVEEYDEDLLEIFLEEAGEILDEIEVQLQSWRSRPGERSVVEGLQRLLHTLKGGARMAGVTPIGNLSHEVESLLTRVVDGLTPASSAMVQLLERTSDRLVRMVEALKQRAPLPGGADLEQALKAMAGGAAAAAEPAAVLAEPPVAAEPPAPAVPPAPAEAPAPAAVVVPSAPAMEQYDQDLLEIFLEEGVEILDAVEAQLQAWKQNPADRTAIELLQRLLHTLKGGARMASVAAVGDLSHEVESLLTRVVDGHIGVSQEMIALLQVVSDRLVTMLDQLKHQQPLVSGEDLVDNLKALAAGRAYVLPESVAAPEPEGVAEPFINEPVAAEVAPKPAVAVRASESEGGDLHGHEPERRQTSRVRQEMVRVRADLFDHLVNLAGESSIYRARVGQQIGEFRGNFEELEETIDRLREQLRHLEIESEAQIQSRYEDASSQDPEFDPLEFDRFTRMQQLSRSISESLNDLVSLRTMMQNMVREAETLLLQQSRVNTELQEGLMQARMVPLVDHAPRLRRVVRQTCSDLGRQAELQFQGAEVELDRSVLERMLAPLEHLLRNAVAHGIEEPAVRAAAKKPAEGELVIALAREGSEVVIRVTDDGRGIDLGSVRRKAVERGLIAANAELSDRDVMQFILESGFSTATVLTQVAGRGVGMDVVNSEVKQLGGSLEIDSRPGQGTTFTIRLPLTLSVSRALLVQSSDEIFAIPLLSIQGIVRVTQEELALFKQQLPPTFRWLEQDYNLVPLAQLVGGMPMPPAEGVKRPLVLAQTGEHRVALEVDSIIGSREVVVKNLGPQLSILHGLSGATILGDGTVAVILDLPNLIRQGLARPHLIQAASEPEKEPEVPTVMVVDDSITVRRVTQRLLERNQMQALTAKDGVEALALLEEYMPDVMLLDIEMPRMDGYELATRIRNSERLRHIPMIMITSRTGDKHRQRALDIGVDRYLGKPFQEADLLDTIRSLIESRRRPGARRAASA